MRSTDVSGIDKPQTDRPQVRKTVMIGAATTAAKRENPLSSAQFIAIRAAALVDLVITAPMASPATARWFIDTIYRLNTLTGDRAEKPPFHALHWLITTLAGSIGVVWAVTRLRSPTAALARADTLARCWVAGLLFYYIYFKKAPRVLMVIILTELSGALGQWYSLRRDSTVRQ
jgi:hypothetical protein